jgi:hypothetical protein
MFPRELLRLAGNARFLWTVNPRSDKRDTLSLSLDGRPGSARFPPLRHVDQQIAALGSARILISANWISASRLLISLSPRARCTTGAEEGACVAITPTWEKVSEAFHASRTDSASRLDDETKGSSSSRNKVTEEELPHRRAPLIHRSGIIR